MRIGIDATVLPRDPVGVGNYIIHLIRALASLDTGDEYVIFAHCSGKGIIGGQDLAGLSWNISRDKTPALRLLWEQTCLPILVRKFHLDLLHSLHYTKPLFLPCASVVTFYDMTFFLFPELHVRFKRLFFPLAMRMSSKTAEALLVPSQNTKQDVVRLLGVSDSRVHVIPFGISKDFRPISNQNTLDKVCREYELPLKFILYVGTLEPRKNLPFLIKAYHKLVKKGEASDLVVVGRLGWMYKEIFDTLTELDLQSRVHFIGYVPSQDLPAIYNLAQALVYPSRYEGFGFPPLEAMACGTPVITAATPPMLDHIGEAGILVQLQDEQALCDALDNLLNDSNLRMQLAQKGLERVAEFTWERTAQETLKVYRKVLSKP